MHVPEASGKLSLTDSSGGEGGTMSAEQDMDSKINLEEEELREGRHGFVK